MPITFPNLTELLPADVAAARALLVQRIQEKAPTVEFRRGVIHDLLINLESIVHAAQESYADKFRKSGSILAIESDPSLADPALVDEVLSNFLITRKGGTKSFGEITLIIPAVKATAIASGSVFVAFGKRFVVTNTFAARTSINSVLTQFDRLIFSIGDGTYGFNVDVEAESVGADTALKQGDRLAMLAPAGGITSAVVAGDFIPGSAIESNLQLIERLKEGVSSKNFSNKYSLSALIKSNFSGINDIGSFGYGDPEQVRYHGLFPVAHGGRVDAYIKGDGLPTKTAVDSQATLVEQRINGGLWQVSFGRNVAPGFYEASRIVRLADKANLSIVNGYETIKIERGFDISDDGTGFSPDIKTGAEAAFTRYQTCTLQFLDTDTDAGLALGVKRDYSFVLRRQRNIAEIQYFLNGADVRPSGSDILVKSAIPFDIRISVVIHNRNKDYVAPLDDIKGKLFDYVNGLGFSSKLYESNLTNDQSIDSVDLRGRLLYPNGTVRYINGAITLAVPDSPLSMVTPRSAAYFLDKSDIQITVQSV
jgi:hypothetical protein